MPTLTLSNDIGSHLYVTLRVHGMLRLGMLSADEVSIVFGIQWNTARSKGRLVWWWFDKMFCYVRLGAQARQAIEFALGEEALSTARGASGGGSYAARRGESNKGGYPSSNGGGALAAPRKRSVSLRDRTAAAAASAAGAAVE